jgi:bifunctional NMN adenylyltransferase/nudix hydrolase
MKKMKIGVFIARLQPFHLAHVDIVKLAMKDNDHVVIILGSACQAKTIKNPWTTDERELMIRKCLTSEGNTHISVVAAKDYFYNDNMWLSSLQSALGSVKVNGVEVDLDDCDVTLYGHDKDRSTFYLHLFPKWKLNDVGNLRTEFPRLDATLVRSFFFKGNTAELRKFIPQPVYDMLLSEMGTSTYQNLVAEFDHITEYRALWASSPYPVQFVTTDALVIKSGHVLMTVRGGYPGKGLIALPGGYLNPDERIVDGCLRELKEETQIAVSKDELRKAIVDQRVFDHPERSLRGRTITHGYCINLGAGDLPKVKRGDDAAEAFWMPLRDVYRREEDFFEDHFHIIFFFTSKF